MYTTRITRTLEENPGARKVRTAVFMEEQGYKNEFDDHDADAVHLCIYDREEGIASYGSHRELDSVPARGSVAVLKERRGHRLGSRAVQELEESLRSLDAKEIELSAQLPAMKMYEALGYKEEGDLIYDEGQPHKMMRKFL